MLNERKCDVDFKPGEQMRMMYYSVMTQANSYIHASIHIYVHILVIKHIVTLPKYGHGELNIHRPHITDILRYM